MLYNSSYQFSKMAPFAIHSPNQALKDNPLKNEPPPRPPISTAYAEIGEFLMENDSFRCARQGTDLAEKRKSEAATDVSGQSLQMSPAIEYCV
jgi:hypothetical protein